jgi:periplasmic protein TonB
VDFGQEQRNPGKHMVGIGVVLGLHVLLGWALLNGLAQRMVEVIKGPIETKIIEEVKPPPPPPPENLPPPPKFAPPPPSFVPPPEVVVNPPPTVAPVITTTTVAPPPAPVRIAPPPVAAPPAPPGTTSPSASSPRGGKARHWQRGCVRTQERRLPGCGYSRRSYRHHTHPFYCGCNG